eukprot:1791366-Rhodomonas_salina.2
MVVLAALLPVCEMRCPDTGSGCAVPRWLARMLCSTDGTRIGLARADAMWVANELLRRGEWQQLTGRTNPAPMNHRH